MNPSDQLELEKLIKRAHDFETNLRHVKLSPAIEPENDVLPLKPANFDDLEVTLEVVLGRKTVTLKELSEINVGSLISLEEGNEEKIALYVNNKKVGHGELVALDGYFGVKITSLD